MSSRKERIAREQVDRLGRPPLDMLDEEIEREDLAQAYRDITRNSLLTMLVLAALAVLLIYLFVAFLRIDGSGMAPALNIDDIVIVWRTREVDSGDIIMFESNNRIYIKRVIGVAGDSVSIDFEGVVSVNDEVLNEPYVSEFVLGETDAEFPFQVRSGAIFVLGDNRSQVMDSRIAPLRPVATDQIVGVVVFRLWPITGFGPL